ncbi:S-layer homology domain-containing protein [Anaerosolibacter sp.]|uniref:S-layer homology domain-containing protein n=1 Tax=Anaerosolibacter sp. TaxID=1872527 RepID=UPI0039F04B3C
MLYKGIRRAIPILLAIILIVSNGLAGYSAQYFTDVTNDHWAKAFIDKLTENQIIKGFDDATFKPNDPVSKTAAISMIYQMLKKTNQLGDETGLVEKHKVTLQAAGIRTLAAWAEPAVAYALEKNIIHPDELKAFFKDGKNVDAKRVDVAVFLAKALNGGDIASSIIIILPFTDADLVANAATKYVNYLVEKDIVNKNGDYMGRFNPNSTISRAEISTMIAKGLDLIGNQGTNNPGTGTNTTPTIPPVVVIPTEEIKTGSITYLDATSKTILIKTNDEKSELYQVGSDTRILLNSSNGSFSDLQLNQEVTLTLTNGNKLSKVEVKTFVPNMEATLNAVVPNTGFTLVVARDSASNTVKSLKATSSTKVELDGTIVTVDKLKIGDILKLRVDGQNIISISATSKTKTYEGVLEAEVSSLTNPVLKVKIDKEIKEFPIDQNAKITKNGYVRWLKDLKRLDSVIITTEYDKVIEIKANSVFSKVTGKIVSLTIAKPTSLLKIIVNGEEKTYSVADNITITINNTSKALYELKVDQLVELELENEEIIEIIARDDLKQKQISGTISSINTTSKTIRVLVYDIATDTTTRRTITYTTSTRITSTRVQQAIGAGALKVNDQIIVIGEEDDDTFTAEKILLID